MKTPGAASVDSGGETGHLDAMSIEVEAYQRHFVDLIARHLHLADRPMQALDLACGTGLAAITLAPMLPLGSRVIALGVDRGELNLLHDKLASIPKRTIFPRKERRDRLPFAPGVFDVVWAALPNERLHPLRAVLSQVRRVLRPGGQLLIAVPLRATFAELANAIAPSIHHHRNHEAYSSLLSQPPQLLGADDWTKAVGRYGAIDVELTREPLELTIPVPLSAQPLFALYLLPLWLGDDSTPQAKALALLDQAVTEPLTVTVHIGCLSARCGPIQESP